MQLAIVVQFFGLYLFFVIVVKVCLVEDQALWRDPQDSFL